MDLLLPDVAPARAAPRIIDNVARFSSPFTQVTRTFARPGDRWGFRLDYENLQGLNRARLEMFLANMRGAANRAIFTPIDYSQRGSFACPELNPNSSFRDATNWTTTGATLSVADRQARVQNTGAAAGYITNTNVITLVVGSAYVARFIAFPGNQSAWRVVGGTTSGGGGVFGLTPATIGYISTAFTAANASMYLSLLCNTSITGDFVTYFLASLSRCALVNGGSQIGSTLTIDKLPISTNGLLLPGDWISVGMELKRVTAPLNSDGSGNGILQFAPPLRASPADNDPIIINQPFGRFILNASENGWEATPGNISGLLATYTLDLVEAP